MVLNFNGTAYTVPSDIMEYLKILDATENVQETLIADFAKKSADSYDGIVRPRTMQSSFSKAAEKYVHLLCEKGIYDQTVEDFIAESNGYALFLELGENASQTHERYSREEQQNLQRRAQAAERRALSQINGSGVSVYSSSFLTLAMSSAVEYSTLKKQYNKANEQYKQSLSYYRFDEENERKRKERNYYGAYYRPQVEKALQLYSYELMQKYLVILIENKLFDKNTLEFVDVSRSQKLLNNLNNSINKDAILEKSFLACPFNADVYIELGKLGKLDKETFESAKTFQLSYLIRNKLEKIFSEVSYSGNIRSDLASVEGVIVSLSHITSHEKIYYYKKFSDPIYESIIYQYQSLHKSVATKEDCLDFLQKYSSNITDSMNEQIKNLAIKRVNQMVSDDEYNAIVSIGKYTDLLEKISPKGIKLKSKSEIDQYDINLICKNVMAVAQEIVTAVSKKNKIIEKKITRYQKVKGVLIAIIILGALIFCITPMVVSSFTDLAFCLVLFMGVIALASFGYLESCKQKISDLQNDKSIILSLEPSKSL